MQCALRCEEETIDDAFDTTPPPDVDFWDEDTEVDGEPVEDPDAS